VGERPLLFVEFPGVDAAQKATPGFCGEFQDRPMRVSGIAHGESSFDWRDLDAVR
jgi:hypothetical protein